LSFHKVFVFYLHLNLITRLKHLSSSTHRLPESWDVEKISIVPWKHVDGKKRTFFRRHKKVGRLSIHSQPPRFGLILLWEQSFPEPTHLAKGIHQKIRVSLFTTCSGARRPFYNLLRLIGLSSFYTLVALCSGAIGRIFSDSFESKLCLLVGGTSAE